MKSILVIAALALNFSLSVVAYAEEAQGPAPASVTSGANAAGIAAATVATPAPAATEEKSFFEMRTLEDLQKLVHVDINEGSADLSSTGAG